ncbi:helix-turn-helix domain-containing protein [Psychroflexus tropicus]|uniref:helix-turn-helix domain-containing protein n=1 Tax=Psychroflexus tropicus TaxID=197345 RepID=UPI000476ACDC|nr:helix-turn-helix domain-containing protein [Psychroflexus tropicus]
MSTDILIQKLERIETLIEQQGILRKDVLNFNEACQYLGLSQSHMYKLTSSKSIPHFCPQGKRLYFKRTELDDWLLRNRTDTQDELDQQAADYLIKKGRVKL